MKFQCRILGIVSEVALKCGRSFDDHKILSWAIGLLCCSLSRKDTLINLSVINKLSLIDESELKSFYNVRWRCLKLRVDLLVINCSSDQ